VHQGVSGFVVQYPGSLRLGEEHALRVGIKAVEMLAGHRPLPGHLRGRNRNER
jgi:hypothetical protein